jgi:hypothetical protein
MGPQTLASYKSVRENRSLVAPKIRLGDQWNFCKSGTLVYATAAKRIARVRASGSGSSVLHLKHPGILTTTIFWIEFSDSEISGMAATDHKGKGCLPKRAKSIGLHGAFGQTLLIHFRAPALEEGRL